MLDPSIDSLMNKLDSKYTLVTVSARRAREMQMNKDAQIENPKSHKFVGKALEEIDAGLLLLHDFYRIFRFLIFCKIALCIFRRRFIRIERNRDFSAVFIIVVDDLRLFVPFFQLVQVRCQQLSVQLIVLRVFGQRMKRSTPSKNDIQAFRLS